MRNKRYSLRNPLRKYYIPALTVKVFGALFIGLIYGYYYGGGDTYYYFNQAQVINSSLNESVIKWINLLLHIPKAQMMRIITATFPKWNGIEIAASYTIVSITAFISIFTLNTYLPTAVLFAFISFSGVWALFKTFCFFISSSHSAHCRFNFIHSKRYCLGFRDLQRHHLSFWLRLAHLWHSSASLCKRILVLRTF